MNNNFNNNFTAWVCFVAFAVVTLTFIPLDALATSTTDTSIEAVLCNIVSFVQSGIGKAVAALAIIAMGFSLFLGKVSWGLMVSTALGIGMIFGAASVVGTISGQGTSYECDSATVAPTS